MDAIRVKNSARIIQRNIVPASIIGAGLIVFVFSPSLPRGFIKWFLSSPILAILAFLGNARMVMMYMAFREAPRPGQDQPDTNAALQYFAATLAVYSGLFMVAGSAISLVLPVEKILYGSGQYFLWYAFRTFLGYFGENLPSTFGLCAGFFSIFFSSFYGPNIGYRKSGPTPWSNGKDMTKFFEGDFVGHIYRDSVGKRTTGYGFNIDDSTVRQALPQDVISGNRNITRNEANRLFDTLYSNAARDAKNYLGEDSFNRLNNRQKDIMTDMAYNMGFNRLSGFNNLKNSIQRGDYGKAANDMKDSRWYRQVGRRSRHHVKEFPSNQSFWGTLLSKLSSIF